MRHLLQTALLLIPSLIGLGITGCSGGAEDDNRDGKALAIYNWADYIGKNTVANFEQRSGIHVDYDTFDVDATLEAKMLTGGSGYDIVSTSTNYFARQIKAGAYLPLNKNLLPNLANMDPKVLALMARFDPGNAHAIPYLHAVSGFAYNVKMIRERMPNAPIDSLDMLFKPEIVSHFADCGVSLLDSAEDVLQLALNYLHLDPNSTRPEDFKAAEQLILSIRPYIKTFDSSEFTNSLATGELCVAMSWSSDYAVSMARARAAGIKLDLAFTVPKEGANVTYNGLLIPFDAPHPQSAHQFLNYIMEPRVIAEVTNDTHYGNDNRAADAFVKADILNDATLYPTPEIMKRLYLTNEVSAETERVRTRSWTRIKTAH